MISPEQCRAARALLNWTQQDLADLSGAGLSSVKGLESGEKKTHARIREMIRKTLENEGVQFLNGDAPGVRLVGKPSPA